jgi:hypothetical protein
MPWAPTRYILCPTYGECRATDSQFHINSLCSRREIACVRWKQTASLFSLAFLSNSNPQESHSCLHPSLPATLQRLHGVIRVAGRSAPLDSEEFKREPVVQNTQHTHTTHTHHTPLVKSGQLFLGECREEGMSVQGPLSLIRSQLVISSTPAGKATLGVIYSGDQRTRRAFPNHAQSQVQGSIYECNTTSPPT